MSCYMLSDRDLTVIASALLRCPYTKTAWLGRCEALGALLHAANRHSVDTRYPAQRASNIADVDVFAWDGFAANWKPSMIALYKLVECYRYQSCEDAIWATGEAQKLTKQLMGWAISQLPGYEEAKWGDYLPSTDPQIAVSR